MNEGETVPGVTVGFMMMTLVEEARARGELTAITLRFDVDDDSNGNAWEKP